MRAAASRTFCTAGSKRPMRMAMMAITTSNSIRVKAVRLVTEKLLVQGSGRRPLVIWGSGRKRRRERAQVGARCLATLRGSVRGGGLKLQADGEGDREV